MNSYDTYTNSTDQVNATDAVSYEDAVALSAEEARLHSAMGSHTTQHTIDNTPTALDAPIFSSYGGAGDSIGFNQVTANSTVKVAGIETSVQAAIAAGLLNHDGTAVTGAHESTVTETEADPSPVETEQMSYDAEAITTLEVIDTYAPHAVDEIIAALTSSDDALDGSGIDTLETVLGAEATDRVNDVVAQAEAMFDATFGSEAENLRAVCTEFAHTPAVQDAMKRAARGDMEGFRAVQRTVNG